MSYSIDRSARTRGVGAVAAMDLRGDNGGGAVVRTGRGAVVIVSKPQAVGAVVREALGALSAHNPYRNQLPWNVKKAVEWEKAHIAKVKTGKIRDVRGGKSSGLSKRTTRRPTGRKVTKVKVVRLPSGAVVPVPTTTDPNAMMAPPSTSSSPFTGGGGGGGGFSLPGGGGGGSADASSPGPDDEASMDPGSEASTQEAAAQPDAVAPDAKPPMSTAVKLAVVGGIGWALWSMFGGGH